MKTLKPVVIMLALASMVASVSASTSSDAWAGNVLPPRPKMLVEPPLQVDVHFDSGKATLKAADMAVLDDLARDLKNDNIVLVVLVATGHSDGSGLSENARLSQRRALAVKAYLVSKGIRGSRIYTEGKGASQPIADEHTDAGRAKNRRVEIDVIAHYKSGPSRQEIQ